MSREPLTLRICRALVASVSWLVPRGQRAEWRQEWEAEVAHHWRGMERDGHPRLAARLGIVRRVVGALPDAAWLRRQFTADSDMVHDLKHGGRLFRRQPAFVVAVVAVLALGIGSVTAVFALVDALLLRPLPYPQPDRLVTVWESNPSAGEDRDEVAPADFLDWKERNRSFESMAAAIPFSFDYTGGATPEVFFALQVTEGFFRTMRVAPMLGRDFRPDEHTRGNDRVVLLDHGFWKRRFGGDPGIVGRTLPLEGAAYTVVGVLPPDFDAGLLERGGPRGVWAPYVVGEHDRQIRGSAWWAVVARLAPGVGLTQAQAEMDAIAGALGREYPRTNREVRATVVPFEEHLTSAVRRPLVLLAGASALLLLLAAANVVGLFLARGAERDRELSVRAALGAHRARLVRQLMAETLLLGVAGGTLGTALAAWAAGTLVALSPVDVPRIDGVRMDGRVIAFAAAVTLAATIACGALSALAAIRSVGRGRLHDTGRTRGSGLTRQPLRRGLVVGQVAAALVLLFGAGLLARSFGRLLGTDPGFRANGVAALQVFAWDRNPTPAKQQAFFRETLRRIQALPGVRTAGVVSRMPFIEASIGIRSPFAIEGRASAAGQEASSFLTVASPGYFEAMGIPLRAGRGFLDSDALGGAPVVLVNDALARRQWAGGDPVGSRVDVRWNGRPIAAEVVGVVGSALHRALDREPEPEVFLSSEQYPFGSMTYVVRAHGDVRPLVGPAQAAVWQVDPQQTFYRTATLGELVGKSLASRRFLLLVLAAFAGVALALAATGLYGLVSFLTSRRTQEIGVRVALGARSAHIFRLVVGEGMILVAAGLVVGIAGGIAAGRLLQGALYGVSPADPATGLVVLATLGAVAFAACAVPAVRALRTDPIAALRND